ncbi:glycosyltransferase family A protein [Roseobacter sp. OBYS 0001]|uniref:glycosyltransferase family 2 protein n=1 Tax=Roseobacter sp. OBYS 0001 TaxID=882651 RepID=UPI001BBDCD76|nr:glycosyltransferase family A protein [Roseobacter sp. OBYS 0001]GIT89249.1 hypothetical protein ROBYS_42650 [Roseobacter sp. OBYS 0001]
MKLDVGVFAYNEAKGIAEFLENLLSQSAITSGEMDVQLFLLANGCTDDTADVARAIIDKQNHSNVKICELTASGKSRTWNTFVHEISRGDTDILAFLDADIVFSTPDVLAQLVEQIEKQPEAACIVSRPVKDLSFMTSELTFVEKLIASGDSADANWHKSICGQLYIMREQAARQIYLPIGLPVEDGFIRAMLLTDNLTKEEDFDRINGLASVFHIFEAERTISSLVRHQVRIIIGSAVNAAVFSFLRKLEPERRVNALKEASRSESWLSEVLRQELPAWPHGWVPVHFLVKRTSNGLKTRGFGPAGLSKIILAFFFDLVVYVLAQARMMRGTGVGFW